MTQFLQLTGGDTVIEEPFFDEQPPTPKQAARVESIVSKAKKTRL